ncbi:MAG: ATPase, T2SS/T4P/T4SS family, partial [bacterium]
MVSLLEMLGAMVKACASDLHLVVGVPPQFRIDGKLISFGEEKLTSETCRELVYSILGDGQKKKLEQERELDAAFSIKDLSRFRVNVYYDRNCVACAIRTIPYHILSFEELGLPNVVKAIARKPRGLVLVTGPTGSGKSTTLASIIDLINNERSCHIITVE